MQGIHWDISLHRKLQQITIQQSGAIYSLVNTIVLYILPNISRSKANQTIKFCQLIEYNMGNIFLENYTENMVEKLVPDPFIEN